jgi:hypothetical protein
MCSRMFPNMVYSDCILFSMFRKLYWMYLFCLMDLLCICLILLCYWRCSIQGLT